ncbi:MAG: class I SAM-dependent methyltransferase [Gemmatimonadaceae bacterium]
MSDTARWVAVYRAMETERPDAIFRDPFARRLAGAKGEEIVATIKRGRAMAWAMIVRTAVFDELITQAIQKDGVEQVVNLAAGLDARPWRMSLPATLRWVDVDLPGILSYKTEALKDERTSCEYEAVHADLTDGGVRRALFGRLNAAGKRTLVVTEGLLIYLTESDVGALATDLASQHTFGWWLIDIAHPRLLKWMSRSWGKAVSAGNAPFRFAPANNTGFFVPFGWREREFRSAVHEAHRLKREMALGWLWLLIDRIQAPQRREETRRMSGVALLERTTQTRTAQ